MRALVSFSRRNQLVNSDVVKADCRNVCVTMRAGDEEVANDPSGYRHSAVSNASAIEEFRPARRPKPEPMLTIAWKLKKSVALRGLTETVLSTSRQARSESGLSSLSQPLPHSHTS